MSPEAKKIVKEILALTQELTGAIDKRVYVEVCEELAGDFDARATAAQEELDREGE